MKKVIDGLYEGKEQEKLTRALSNLVQGKKADGSGKTSFKRSENFGVLPFEVTIQDMFRHAGMEKESEILDLVQEIIDRKENLPEGSYTTKLFKNEFYLKRKIMEEAFESVNYEQGDGLEWEASDLTYHMLTFMAMHNVTPQDIVNNLASRTK